MVEIPVHELTHVVVGSSGREDDDHGEKWREVYTAIYLKYNELVVLAEREFNELL